jgi:hypothetical protein
LWTGIIDKLEFNVKGFLKECANFIYKLIFYSFASFMLTLYIAFTAILFMACCENNFFKH